MRKPSQFIVPPTIFVRTGRPVSENWRPTGATVAIVMVTS
jgi:hypothetical protein